MPLDGRKGVGSRCPKDFGGWYEASGSCFVPLRAMCMIFLSVSWGLYTCKNKPPFPNPRATSCISSSGGNPSIDPNGSLPVRQGGHILQCRLPCSGAHSREPAFPVSATTLQARAAVLADPRVPGKKHQRCPPPLQWCHRPHPEPSGCGQSFVRALLCGGGEERRVCEALWSMGCGRHEP